MIVQSATLFLSIDPTDRVDQGGMGDGMWREKAREGPWDGILNNPLLWAS